MGIAVLGGLHRVFDAGEQTSVPDNPQTVDAKRGVWLSDGSEVQVGSTFGPELFQIGQASQSGPAAERPRLSPEELRSPELQAIYDARAKPGDFVTPPSVSVPH